MPPSIKYVKKDIVKAAVGLIREKGVKYFSARNVAKALKSSTQPIYSCFSDSGELYDAVMAEIKLKLIAHTEIEYTDKVFRNMGLGFTYFARDYPNLFIAFFQENEQNQKFIEQFLKDLRTALDQDVRFLEMSAGDKDLLLEKMWIFTYGYANLIIKGMVRETSDADIEKMIVEVGLAVIKEALGGEGTGR